MKEGDKIRLAVEYGQGLILAQYHKLIRDWCGDEFESTLPDDVLFFLQSTLAKAKEAGTILEAIYCAEDTMPPEAA